MSPTDYINGGYEHAQRQRHIEVMMFERLNVGKLCKLAPEDINTAIECEIVLAVREFKHAVEVATEEMAKILVARQRKGRS